MLGLFRPNFLIFSSDGNPKHGLGGMGMLCSDGSSVCTDWILLVSVEVDVGVDLHIDFLSGVGEEPKDQDIKGISDIPRIGPFGC